MVKPDAHPDAAPLGPPRSHDSPTSNAHTPIVAGTDVVSEQGLARLSDAERFNGVVGPLHSTSSLMAWLDLTRHEIDSLVDRREILALRLADGWRAYPAWQFGHSGELLPGMAQVSEILDAAGDDPLTVALALGNESELFGGRTGAELLRAGDTQTVLDAVSRAARALTD